MKNLIHVNQHIIKANKKTGARDAPLTVKNYKGNRKASEVIINGPCRVVYSLDKPLPCGASVWIECMSGVEVVIQPTPAESLPCPNNAVLQESCP